MFARNQSIGVPPPNTLVVKDDNGDDDDSAEKASDTLDSRGPKSSTRVKKALKMSWRPMSLLFSIGLHWSPLVKLSFGFKDPWTLLSDDVKQ